MNVPDCRGANITVLAEGSCKSIHCPFDLTYGARAAYRIAARPSLVIWNVTKPVETPEGLTSRNGGG